MASAATFTAGLKTTCWSISVRSMRRKMRRDRFAVKTTIVVDSDYVSSAAALAAAWLMFKWHWKMRHDRTSALTIGRLRPPPNKDRHARTFL